MLALLALSIAFADPVELSTAALDALCDRVASLSVPVADATPPAGSAPLASCDSAALYYGIGAPRDVVRARLCAASEVAAGDDQILGGSAILTMIYANGEGVPRDPDLAAHFACVSAFAPAERDLRVAHALHLGPGERLDFCDDVTSGMMSGVCASLQERIAAQARAEREAKAVAALPAAAREKLPALEAARDRYIEARVGNEIDLTGTMRAALQIGEEARLRDAYVAALERALSPDFPPAADEAAYARADAELNATYKKLMAGQDTPYTTISRAGRRATERAWLAYRDAWVSFGAAARPEVPASAWLTWATRIRTAEMEDAG